jgi:hypothetical protein
MGITTSTGEIKVPLLWEREGKTVSFVWAPDDTMPGRRCNRCGRRTWAADLFGAEDRMTQPDGNPCGGRFES